MSQKDVINDSSHFWDKYYDEDNKTLIVENATINVAIAVTKDELRLFKCVNVNFKYKFYFKVKTCDTFSVRLVHFENFFSLRGEFTLHFELTQTEFHSASSISMSKFCDTVYFNLIKIHKRFEIFVDNKFEKNLIIKHLEYVDKSEGLFFYETIFFRTVEFYDNKLNYLSFNQCSFESDVKFESSSINTLNLISTNFNSTIKVKNLTINTGAREVFRQMKHQMVLINNKIDALYFHKKEMSAYWNELGWNNIDKWILFLNKWSNSFGLNPWKGIAFTVILSAFGFFPQLLLVSSRYFDWGWNGWYEFWETTNITLKLWITYINPAHSINFLERHAQPNAITYLWGSIFRIFVGYGYYQTIQAFRKFGRW